MSIPIDKSSAKINSDIEEILKFMGL